MEIVFKEEKEYQEKVGNIILENFDKRLQRVEDIVSKEINYRIENHEKRLEFLESNQHDDTKVLVELTAILKSQDETNKQQNAQLEKVGETMQQISEQMSQMSMSQFELSLTQSNTSSKVTDLSEQLEKIKEKNEENKIDVPKLLTTFVRNLVLGLTAVVISWLVMKLGK